MAQFNVTPRSKQFAGILGYICLQNLPGEGGAIHVFSARFIYP
jgi:hypothetical protein